MKEEYGRDALYPHSYLISIDDVLNDIRNVLVQKTHFGKNGLCFADDTLVIADSIADAYEKMSLIKDWMIKNQMALNVQKCGVLKYPASANDTEAIYYDSQVIPMVGTYTYLGVEINDELDEKRMANARIRKGYEP